MFFYPTFGLSTNNGSGKNIGTAKVMEDEVEAIANFSHLTNLVKFGW